MLQINTLLVAGLDIRNAFNTVSRLAMLEECQASLPQLFPLARACYADASTLFYRDDEGITISPRPPARSRVTLLGG